MELVLVVDSRIFAQLGRSEARVHGACQQLVARMGDIYRPLNIYPALTAVVIWRNHDQAHNDTSYLLVYHVLDIRDRDIPVSRFHCPTIILSTCIVLRNCQSLLCSRHFFSYLYIYSTQYNE